MYGVKEIWGIRGGYKGAIQPHSWMELSPENVQAIHNLGGSILVSDRGNPTKDDRSKLLIEVGFGSTSSSAATVPHWSL